VSPSKKDVNFDGVVDQRDVSDSWLFVILNTRGFCSHSIELGQSFIVRSRTVMPWLGLSSASALENDCEQRQWVRSQHFYRKR